MSLKIFSRVFLIILIVVFFGVASAKFAKINIATIYADSDIVALGSVLKLSGEEPDDWVLIAEIGYKGGQSERVFNLCSAACDHDDPYYVQRQRAFFFLRQNGYCFETVSGYKGLIRPEGGKFLIIAIDGEPSRQMERQLADSLLKLSNLR